MQKVCRCGRVVSRTPCSACRTDGAHATYDHRWRRLSEQHRAKNPLCKNCWDNGITTPADDVDHIVPIYKAPGRKYDPTNLQSLCKKCHIEKTKRDV